MKNARRLSAVAVVSQLVLSPAMPGQEPVLTDTSGEESAAAEATAIVAERDPDPWPRVLEGDSYLVKLHPPQVDD